MKIKNTISAIAAACGLLAFATSAQAHTISIGTYNAGSPGSVTVAMGTYTSGHSGVLFAQGAITLTSGPGIPPNVGPVSFGGFTTTIPVQLISSGPSQNNFFANSSGGGYTSLTNTTGQTIANWQTATFTGLTAGTYGYQISGMTNVTWANWSTGQANWSGTLVIPNSSVTGVPDAGSSLALLGLALMGVVGFRKKFAV